MAGSEGIHSAQTPPAHNASYQVVARRYRPRTFEELVGQEHVGSALAGAITSGRIGHAYLFTGARGVGKTSTARIFAKALNCEQGLSPRPCNECETCQGIAAGEDVDVLEIDGASNRGIDEIRQLRQNASIRPSRARYKVYIIDEVHMLTREAFNALLKTLEEPPEHVKFIFCTTEPTKIPITILSRCQRFDFAGIESGSILERLGHIAAAEGIGIEDEALRLLSRRAAGSMRDAQSLLEQLLAFGADPITVADVHEMLGTASEDRLAGLVDCLVTRDAAGALAAIDVALQEGVDVGLLVEQLFGYLRDMMVAGVGGSSELFLFATAAGQERIVDAADTWRLDSVLAAMQILEQTLARMRYSTQGRLLAELAVVRICRLEQLQDIATLIADLQSGTVPAAAAPRSSGAAQPVRHPATEAANVHSSRPPKTQTAQHPDSTTEPAKKNAAAGEWSQSTPAASAEAPPEAVSRSVAEAEPLSPGSAEAEKMTAPVEAIRLSPENATRIWEAAVAQIPGMLASYARSYESIAISAPNSLVVCMPAEYTLAKSVCERPEQLAKFEDAVSAVVGQKMRVQFQITQAVAEKKEKKPARAAVMNPEARLRAVGEHPLIQKAGELFGATAVDIIPPREG